MNLNNATRLTSFRLRACFVSAQIVVVAAALSACSALEGLGDFSKGDCSGGNCDGGALDSTTPGDGSPGSDSAVDGAHDANGSDAGGDGQSGDDGSPGSDSGAPDAGVDASWGGRPPAMPLAVRTPYLSVWMPADDTSVTWPSFWNANTRGMCAIAMVDGAAYVLLGSPNQLPPSKPLAPHAHSMTPTKSEYVYWVIGTSGTPALAITLDFLSPVEPGDLARQSAPLSYITASAASQDGFPHTVAFYFDMSAEGAHGDVNQLVNWSREMVPYAGDAGDGGGGTLVVQSFSLVSPAPLTEVNQAAAWGSPFLAAADSPGAPLTYAIGEHYVMRSQVINNGALDDTIDQNLPRKINNQWPVLAYSFALGSVTDPTPPVTLVVGHERDPAVSFLGTAISPLWKAYWSKWEDMVADAYADGPAAAARAAALDNQIVADAYNYGGSVGNLYAGLVTLSLRQAFAGTELVGPKNAPWMFLKEISSSGNTSTVDVIFPSSPAFLYTNPLYLKLLLDPILAYVEATAPGVDGGAPTPLWPQPYAPHDLGEYPTAAGHNDGGGENMPIEETGNMLIMMAAFAQRAQATDATNYAKAHAVIAKKWADYLVANTADPGCQNQTDDFTGSICHSVNLALKGIIGVGAYAILADLAGNKADHDSYMTVAKNLIGTWQGMAEDTGSDHLLLQYGTSGPTSWSLKYNALYDKLLGLNIVPQTVLDTEAAWYLSQAQSFGVVLDPRNHYTKTDWSLFAAAAVDNLATRKAILDGVYQYATQSAARVPFGDWYCVSSGNNTSNGDTCTAGTWKGFEARPVQGGIFSILARYAQPVVTPVVPGP